VKEESIERLDRVDLFEKDQDLKGEVVQPVRKVLQESQNNFFLRDHPLNGVSLP